MLSPRKLRSLLLGLLALAACTGETADDAPLPEPRGVPAVISFEAIAYIDPAASNARIIERIRRQTESVIGALHRQQIEVTRKRQVDVDVRRVVREPMTLVDPTSGARRPTLRVRYWFVGSTSVPAEMLRKGTIPFGLLATDDESQVDKLGPCLTEGTSGKPLVQRFDPTPTACQQAILAEQSAINAARAPLRAPTQEIVPAEQDRLTLPISLHLTVNLGKSARKELEADAALEVPGSAPSSDVNGNAPGGVERPGTGNGVSSVERPGSGRPSEHDGPSSTDKQRERERAEAEADDDHPEEVRKVRAPTLILPSDKTRPAQSGGYSVITEPNFLLLWLLGLIVVLIAANEFRRNWSKGRRR